MRGSLAEARARLRAVFGLRDFRPGQEAVIAALLAGEDVLAVMPTGSGKSLCYQLPALLGDGLTVVVSPLIALMRDQVAQMRALGVAAAALNSANPPGENRRVVEKVRAGGLALLYAAPERLALPETTALLRASGVRLLAIDEAHCVSQWGHDFRPEYLSLGALRATLDGVRTIALTATADAATRSEIERKLFDRPPRVFVHGFDRPNIGLAMRAKRNAERQLLEFLDRHAGHSGIVYCASRKGTDDLARALAARGLRAVPYHAGMEKAARAANQDLFLREDGVVVVATVAFGMGIDKPDVRFVCHANMPQTIENYYQEIGRAGRDGLPAETLTLYGLDDMRLRRAQIEESGAEDDKKRIEHQRLTALVALCEAPRCRRETLLAYFGERSAPCGNCDLCADGVEVVDGSVEAQKLLSAVARTGERFGTEHIVAIVRGEETGRIRRFGHHRLPTFGVGADRSKQEWRGIVRQLYAAGCLTLEIADHGRWSMTDEGRAVMRGQRRFEMRRDAATSPRPRRARAAEAAPRAAALPVEDAALFEALKALRRRLAEEEDVPAYVVFPDRTLIELADARPATRDAMRGVHGVGAVKLEKYGDAFLAAIAAAPPRP